MTKLESIEHKIFASEAPLDEIGQFGSALDTTKLNTKDVTTIQALPAYTKGWGSAIISDNNYPTMEEMNGVLNVMSYHTGYLYQEGMPAWRSDREYSATSIVKEPTGTKFFHSLKDGNIGNNIYDTEWWEELKLGGSGLEVCDIGMALYVDETKGLRRYLNGQIVDINANTQLFLNRLLKIKTTNPDYFTTEENWQAEKTMNLDGCVYKFVLNYDSTGTNVVSVRLPKYPDYVEINNNSINNTAPVAVYGNGRGLGLVDSVNSPTYRTLIDYSYPNNIEGLVPGNLTFDHNTVFPVGTNTSKQSGYIRNVFWGVSQNANTSGLTGTATITSNFRQTKLKMRYFIQIATGQETENNIVNEIELNNPYVFGKSEYSKTPKDNLSWLASKGQWNPKGSYPSYYDWILENVNNGVEDFKLSTDTYDDYSWVINTADETFRLPLLDGSEDLLGAYSLIQEMPKGVSTLWRGNNGQLLVMMNNTGNNDTWLYMNNQTQGQEVDNSGIAGWGRCTLPVRRGDKVYIDYNLAPNQKYFKFCPYVGNGSLYYYVGETVQNADLVDAGRIGEILPTKLDASKVKAYIVETYRNGSSWYRIYSDGWCEQGGLQHYQGAPYGLQTVTLLKPYIDTNYTVTTYIVWGAEWFTNTSIAPNLASSTDAIGNITNRTKSSFDIQRFSTHFWKAEGYIA